MREQTGKQGDKGKDKHDLVFAESAFFEVMMQGRHAKKSFTRTLENEHLQNYRTALN